LSYSLIKAYWPEVAGAIEQVPLRRIPASKLASHAVRVAATDAKSGKLPRSIGIPRLRAIASGISEHDKDLQKKIRDFLGCELLAERGNRLAIACQVVDEWLSYSSFSPAGLPPVLVSSFARNSQDYYVFLIHLADSLGTKAANPEWKRLLPGIITLLHWFTREGEHSHVADHLLRATSAEPTPNALLLGLQTIQDRLIIPHNPSAVRKFISCHLLSDESISEWQWWKNLVEYSNEGIHERERIWRHFFEKTAWNREMLLYAQRHFLAERFSDYDPSRRDLWDSRNRPWDFDHLHASKYFHHRNGPYANVCRQWGNCIGNLRAWPFEDNRSEQAETLKDKLADNPLYADWSFINPKHVEAFSHGDKTRHELSKAYELCDAIKERYVSIYEEWHVNTHIAELLTIN
jgi:hypothetical protein